jgi:murein DD-endopeptidase MepM/ murein hydrolase activator NlpD
VVLTAGLVSPHLVLKVRAQSEQVAQLQAERRRLQAENEQFEVSIASLRDRLDTFESRTQRLATALGIRDSQGLEPAAGGPPDTIAGQPPQGILDEELESLSVRTDGLEQSLEQLADTWEQRERVLASTPSVMPVRGWFSDGYGWRKDPITGKRVFHQGLDIVAPVGAVVRAPGDAVVTRATRTAGYGKMVDLSHGYGYRTRYGHLSEVLVKPGQKVRRGDPIGRVGSTGRSTGPHLHYEVYREGVRVNPWTYIGDGK